MTKQCESCGADLAADEIESGYCDDCYDAVTARDRLSEETTVEGCLSWLLDTDGNLDVGWLISEAADRIRTVLS